jgi:hypothetical protein
LAGGCNECVALCTSAMADEVVVGLPQIQVLRHDRPSLRMT